MRLFFQASLTIHFAENISKKAGRRKRSKLSFGLDWLGEILQHFGNMEGVKAQWFVSGLSKKR